MELYGVIGAAPLKWNTCRPLPATARSLPDGDMFMLEGFTFGVGMFADVFVEVKLPFASAVKLAS